MKSHTPESFVKAYVAAEREQWTGPSVQHTHGCCADKACTDKTCMELPKGTACGDCANFRHCEAFYAHSATDTYCDFYPRRFRERPAKATGEQS